MEGRCREHCELSGDGSAAPSCLLGGDQPGKRKEEVIPVHGRGLDTMRQVWKQGRVWGARCDLTFAGKVARALQEGWRAQPAPRVTALEQWDGGRGERCTSHASMFSEGLQTVF